MSKLSILAVAAAAALAAGTASAGTADFDSVPLGTYSSITDGGVTFTFTDGTGLFDVVAWDPDSPLWGHNLTAWNTNPGSGAFKATMSGGFAKFAIGCGDYGADDDECHLEAYDGGGHLIASDYFYNPAGNFGGGMLSVASATPISYVLFYETGSYAGAVAWDNAEFTAAAVPEPQTWALMGLGLAGLAAFARRRQAK